MTRNFILMALFCIGQSVFSQTNSTEGKTIELGGRFGFYVINDQPALNYYGYVTARKGMHELSLGPSVGRPRNFYNYKNDLNPYKLNGVDLTYRITPNRQGKIFNCYFQASYFQKWAKGDGIEWFANCMDYYLRPEGTGGGTIRSISSQLMLECGFDIKFLNHFYVESSVGFGPKVEFIHCEDVSSETLSFTDIRTDFNFMYRASIGFRF